MKINKTLIITIALGLTACVIVVILHLFTVADLWFQMFAALLGVIITAIITEVLLKGQTESDVKREESAAVFREKLKIYMDFLKMLCETLKDKRLTEEESMQMQFQISYIAMHTKLENVEKISKNVNTIVEVYTKPGHKPTSSELLPPLFNIVECFRQELYPNQKSSSSKDNFNEKYEQILSYLKVFDNDNYAVLSSSLEYDAFKNSMNEKGWAWSEKKDGNGYIHIELAKQDSDGNRMRLFVAPQNVMGTSKYIIGLEYKDKEIYKDLKTQEKGIIDKERGYWFKYLDEDCSNLGEAFAEKLRTDKNVQKKVLTFIRVLEQYISNYATLHPVRQYLEKRDLKNWTIKQWYDKTLACDFQNRQEGIPYLDIILNDGGRDARFEIGNRAKDQQMLEITLSRTDIKTIHGNTCDGFAHVPVGDLLSQTIEMMKKIEGVS